MSENGEIYTAGKNFTLPPALTALTNFTSDSFNNFVSKQKLQQALKFWSNFRLVLFRGGICHSRHCRRQCKIFASGVNFSIFTHFLCFFLLKLLKLGEIDGVNFLAWKSGGVKFLTNSMSVTDTIYLYQCIAVLLQWNEFLNSHSLFESCNRVGPYYLWPRNQPDRTLRSIDYGIHYKYVWTSCVVTLVWGIYIHIHMLMEESTLNPFDVRGNFTLQKNCLVYNNLQRIGKRMVIW